MIYSLNDFNYELFNNEKGWNYIIYDKDNSKLIHSEDVFTTEQRAQLAAIGNILLITEGRAK